MPEPAGGIWRAYVDASESNRRMDPDTYVLAAAVLEDATSEAAREILRRLRFPGTRKLHWYNEPPARRRKIVEALCEFEALHVVVVRSGAPGERSERRRRLCLERLLYELSRAAVDHICLEARQEKQNQRGRHMVEVLRARRTVSRGLRLCHVPGPAEPLLWVADAVCGAVTADRCNDPAYLKTLSGAVELHHLGP